MLTDPDQFNDIRDGVRAVCAEFPGEYHRKIDHDRAYPEAFVAALTKGRLDGGLDPRGIWRLWPVADGG